MHPPTVDLRQSCTTQFGSAYLKNREITGYTTPAKFHQKNAAFSNAWKTILFGGAWARGDLLKFGVNIPTSTTCSW